MATYAIGDIQGCFDSLMGLVAALPLTASDRIWLCGDLVNRGPKSAEVLRWARDEPRVQTVLGNHDLHLLAAAQGQRKPKLRDTLESVLDAPDCDELLAWLVKQPILVRDEGHVLVHAGLHPSWSIDDACGVARECEQALADGSWAQAWERSRRGAPPWRETLAGVDRMASALSVFLSARCFDRRHCLVDYAGPVHARPEGTEPWFALRPTDEQETIVFGHWAALGFHRHNHCVCLDSGCVWGHALTALRLDDGAVFSQAALEVAR